MKAEEDVVAKARCIHMACAFMVKSGVIKSESLSLVHAVIVSVIKYDRRVLQSAHVSFNLSLLL